MAQYQSFVKEEGFAPVDVPDVTPYINENLEALRRSEQKNVQDLYTRDKGRADEIAKSFQGISDISSKLGKFLEERGT